MAQDRDWTTLFKIGGLAALLAGLLFRRNLGAEASLLVGVDAIPRQSSSGMPCSRAIRGLGWLFWPSSIWRTMPWRRWFFWRCAPHSGMVIEAGGHRPCQWPGRHCGRFRGEYLADDALTQPAICRGDLGGKKPAYSTPGRLSWRPITHW